MGADLTGLDAWLTELRGRLARGELDGLDSVDLDGAAELGTATFVRIMLADLEHYDELPPELQRDPLVMARRLYLLGDLWKLRSQIG
ncbi:MAG: hypothetical protein M3O34_14735 [Chloroflexota bacterium]|nr:hypothetical protein [Chloroflexota bacterium]